jgi:hypothetical protein
VPYRIDDRPGRELGLTGGYADRPAFQIVNDAHELLLALASHLVSLEYGKRGGTAKTHPLWPMVDAEYARLADRLAALKGDAVAAAALSEDIRRLDKAAVDLATLAKAAGSGA